MANISIGRYTPYDTFLHRLDPRTKLVSMILIMVMIFFSYGVNDMGMNIDAEEGGYDGQYESQIKKIVEVCPDATIIVNSIIPATPAAVQKSPSWGNVDAYNTKIKSMCEKNKWIYVDNSEISQNGNANIYQNDGIHFLTTFYSTWAENMIMTVRND